jgi:cell division protein FtsZ
MRERINFTPDYGVKATQSIIKVIGVGGGGGNAVKHMYKEGIIGVDFLICNTDRNALEANPIPSKLVLGESGLGAGANPEVARQLALESREQIIEFLGTETKMLFITAGMGKGTGTGAAPVVAEIAKELGFLTIAVVTMPFHFEGTLRAQLAEAGVAELRKHVDSLIIIKNENLFKHYNKEKADTAFGYADDVLKNAVKCIAELVTVHSEQNIDFNDINTILKQSGSAMLAIAEASGENRVEVVLDKALHCPLLAEEHISNAKNFLFSISYGSEKVLLMDELKVLTDKFNELISKNAHVIWGRSEDPALGDKIKLSVIISKYSTDSIEFGAVGQIQNMYEGEKQRYAQIIDIGTTTTSPSSPLNMEPEIKDEFENIEKEEDDFGFLNKIEPYDTTREIVTEPRLVSSYSEFNPEPQMLRRIYEPVFEEKTQFKELIEIPAVQRIRQESKEDFQDKAIQNNLTSTFMTEDDVHDFFKSLPD